MSLLDQGIGMGIIGIDFFANQVLVLVLGIDLEQSEVLVLVLGIDPGPLEVLVLTFSKLVLLTSAKYLRQLLHLWKRISQHGI